MKNKLILCLSALLFASLLFSCSNGEEKKPDETTATEKPENGVYYEYSSGGNSERVVSSTTYKNGIAVSSNEYDYWED